jgi:DNA-binding transcriptional regulator YbjK
LQLLARDGARGLTHRAIDRALGWPQGSTSHFCQTRLELLSITCKRLVTVNLADTEWMVEMADGRLGPVTTETFADGVTAMCVDWLSPEKRWRILARNELFLGAARAPALDKILAVGTKEFHARQERLFRQLNAVSPGRAADQLLCYGTGVLFAHALSDPGLLEEAELKSLMRLMVERLRGL